jgi:DNA polymerase sigma
MLPERTHVLARLQALAERTFPHDHPKIELFGSLITGLALESSDMDIAVVGLEIGDRYAMIEDLKKLSTVLQVEFKGSIDTFKAIETASIPVIKMKVDLVRLRDQEMAESEEGDFARRPIPDNQRYLNVDITFDDSSSTAVPMSMYQMPYFEQENIQTKTHLGLASCRLVQSYIANYRHMKPVAILLKRFLAIHNFNSPYYGGLSSYSTAILIVAFMNYFGLANGMNGGYLFANNIGPYGPLYGFAVEEMTPSRLLMAFLDFYVSQFNPAISGISVVGNG